MSTRVSRSACGCTGGGREEQPKRDVITALVRASYQMGFAVWSGFSLELCSSSHRKHFLCMSPDASWRRTLRPFHLGWIQCSQGGSREIPMGLGLKDSHVPLWIPVFPLFLMETHYSRLPGELGGLQRQPSAFHCCNRQVLTSGNTGRGETLPPPSGALEETRWEGNLSQALKRGKSVAEPKLIIEQKKLSIHRAGRKRGK